MTPEQEQLCGPRLAKLLSRRVAYHHSGLSYAQRAGVIEPLAKAGQLRAVVATLGLSAGINFSLRSVLITAASYRHDHLEREIAPHDLLQMIGRAGRRGLDDMGYVLVSTSTPRMRRAEPLRLKRAAALPWAFFLRQLRAGRDATEMARTESLRFFTSERMLLGVEHTSEIDAAELPCAERTDTARARLVRRERNPFPGVTAALSATHASRCRRRRRCSGNGSGRAFSTAISTSPCAAKSFLFSSARKVSLWPRLSRIAGTRSMICFLTPRICSRAIAFRVRTRGASGRLADACTRAYRRQSIDGWLHEGVPLQYGSGASESVRALIAEGARTREVLDEVETAGRGDLDRLLTEWRSLLRQVASAGPLIGDGAPMTGRDHFIAERWDEFRTLARHWLNEARIDSLPDLPLLTADQRRVVNHSVLRNPRPAPPGRAHHRDTDARAAAG